MNGNTHKIERLVPYWSERELGSSFRTDKKNVREASFEQVSDSGFFARRIDPRF